jgi:D-xylose transport system ATP-binding protein
MSDSEPIIRLDGLTKSYGGVHALRSAGLELRAGRVTALVGDNGAGKSTLVKSMTGVVKPDSGTIHVNGEQVTFRSPRDAADAGIAAVYQDLAMCPNLDVTSNLFLGRERTTGRRRHILSFIDRVSSEREARRQMSNLHIKIQDFRVPVESLSGGQRQSVAIARALVNDPIAIILDEPTAALSVGATQEVLQLVRNLRDAGQAVLIISHSLTDVFAVADDITVLRLGANAGVFETSKTTPQEILAAMTGVLAPITGM